MKRKALAIFLSTLMLCTMLPLSAISASARSGVYNGMTYIIEDGEVTITGYTDELPADLVIPETIEDCPVVSFGYSWYAARTDAIALVGCQHLASITVSELNPYYTSIDGVLFNKDCTTLIMYPSAKAGDYVIPNSVKHIRQGAFYDCDRLTSVFIPHSVTKIEFRNESPSSDTLNSFTNCTNLSSFIVDEQNSTYASVEGVLLDKAKTQLLLYPWGKTGSYVTPLSVTYVRQAAFTYCSKLTELFFTNTNLYIDKIAITYCSTLTTITLRTTKLFPSMQSSFYSHCPNLTDIYYDNNSIIDYSYLKQLLGDDADIWHFPHEHYDNDVAHSVMDTEKGNGLAFRFELKASGVSVKKGAEIDLTNATIDYSGRECKLIAVGAILTNDLGCSDSIHFSLDCVNNITVLEIPAVYLQEVEEDFCAFAVRIINIPDSATERPIFARPYYTVEVDGEKIVVYGDVNRASCVEYM